MAPGTLQEPLLTGFQASSAAGCTVTTLSVRKGALAASQTVFAQQGLLISSGKSASALREAGGRLQRDGGLSRPPQGSLISGAVVEATLDMV